MKKKKKKKKKIKSYLKRIKLNKLINNNVKKQQNTPYFF